jgi:uncharacterized small protein (DUF1192 family)
MAIDDTDRPKPKPTVTVGQDLSFQGVAELEDRIAALEEEITRVRREIAKRQSTRAAADSFFKS